MARARPRIADLAAAAPLVPPLVLAALIVIPALPVHGSGPLAALRQRAAAALAQISFSQSWGMYAPDPWQGYTYLRLTGVYPGGVERELPDGDSERPDGRAPWLWDRTREEFWRLRVSLSPAHMVGATRLWYLRGICVREARHGPGPERIRMERAIRWFRTPEEVRRGETALREERVSPVLTVDCTAKLEREMIQEDRARRAGG